MSRWSRRRAGGPAAIPAADAGSATAELAASLPALMLLLAVALGAVVAVRAQLQCVDAAREAARAAARGDSGAQAGARAAPPGATTEIDFDGQLVRARVSVELHPLGPDLPGIPVTATAVAQLEPGVAGSIDVWAIQ